MKSNRYVKMETSIQDVLDELVEEVFLYRNKTASELKEKYVPGSTERLLQIMGNYMQELLSGKQ
jgi:hypothetical protein